MENPSNLPIPTSSWSCKRWLGTYVFNALLAKVALKASVLLFAALVAASPFCATQVKDYELVVVREWGKRVEGAVNPGLRWFWPMMNTIHRYDTRPRMLELCKSYGEGEPLGVGARTRDRWHIGVLTTIHYTLDRAMWREVDDNFGSDDSQQSRKQIEDRITAEVRHAIQNLAPQYDMSYLLAHRAELIQNTLATLQITSDAASGTQTDDKNIPLKVTLPEPLPAQRLKQVGINIKYLTMQFDTPAEYDKQQNEIAVVLGEARRSQEELAQVAQQKKLAEAKSELQNIESKSKAEAELELLKVQQQAPAIFSFLQRWDGHLPEFMGGSDALSAQLFDHATQMSATPKRPAKTADSVQPSTP